MREALLVIDKGMGPTSFDIVRQVKRLFAGEKVGHTGSLDPFATGVLVLLLGRATKLSNLLLNADKSYRALVKLGSETDTYDRTGTVTVTEPVPPLTLEHIDEVLQSFKGEWLQTPPMYSAKKINGVRLYELARQNVSVPREPVAVNLYELKLLGYTEPYLEFEVHCSKGTYIRSLAAEIGKRLGTVGHLAELRRLTCGVFSLEESISLEQLSQDVPGWVTKGYRNYIRLLRAEGLVRRPIPTVADTIRQVSAERFGSEAEIASPADERFPREHLQMPVNNGTSLLN